MWRYSETTIFVVTKPQVDLLTSRVPSFVTEIEDVIYLVPKTCFDVEVSYVSLWIS